MSLEEHKKAMARLRRLGRGGIVVMTAYAGVQGLKTSFPIGEIVAFGGVMTVRVRKLGRSTATNYAAGFWAPAPKRLINHLRLSGD